MGEVYTEEHIQGGVPKVALRRYCNLQETTDLIIFLNDDHFICCLN